MKDSYYISKRAFFGRAARLLALAGCIGMCPLMGWSQGTLPPAELDASFNPQADDYVYAVAVQPGNQVLVGGNFTKINNTARNYLARLNADGSLDASFAYLSGADNTVRTLALQTDGRILVGGDFNSIQGINWSHVARLNADGSVDSTFDQLTGANARVRVVVQDDNQVLVGGEFTKMNGVTRNYLARLNANGSLDSGFNPSFNSTVYALVVLADKKVLVGGDFTSVNNQPLKYLARLNSDGSLDAGFTVNADSTVFAMAPQSDGKVILGGYFGRVGDVYHSGLARLNGDGTLDALFTAGTSGTIYSLAIETDDQILVGGRFSVVNNITRNNIARLNANGLLDATFDPGQGPNYTVQSVALQSDGKIVLGGGFNTVNALDHNYLARLNGTPPPPVGQDVTADIWRAVEVTWNSVTNAQYQLQWAAEVNTNTWNNLGAAMTGTGLTMSVFDSTRDSAHKYYRVKKY